MKDSRVSYVCVETRGSHCFCCLSFNPNGLFEKIRSRSFFFHLLALVSFFLVVLFLFSDLLLVCTFVIVCAPPEAESQEDILLKVLCHKLKPPVTVIKIENLPRRKWVLPLSIDEKGREYIENLFNGERTVSFSALTID